MSNINYVHLLPSCLQAGVAHSHDIMVVNGLLQNEDHLSELESGRSGGGRGTNLGNSANDFLSRVVQTLVDVDILTAEDLQAYRQTAEAAGLLGGRQSRSEK